jgi:SRSO17 transposase
VGVAATSRSVGPAQARLSGPPANLRQNGTRQPKNPPITGSTPSAGTPTAELARLAEIRWPIEHDYLEHDFGHFEGRSDLGWHRYVTRAALAQAF